MAQTIVLLVVLVYLTAFNEAAFTTKSVNKLELSKPAFAQLGVLSGNTSLLVTGFSPPLGGNNVFAVPGLASQYLAPAGSLGVDDLATNIKWPNTVTVAPAGSLAAVELVLVASGFLVPGYQTGAVTAVAPTRGNAEYVLTTPKSGWFYHRTVLKDIDGDGLLDVVAARVSKPLLGPQPAGQLIWLQQPAGVDDPLAPHLLPWQERLLFTGPEIFFDFVDLDGDGQQEVVAPQFFAGDIVVYALGPQARGNWTDAAAITAVLVDNTIGPPFDCSVVDANADGRLDLACTNHVDDAQLAGLYAYQVPDQLLQPMWTRHTLASGFKVLKPGNNQAAPGAAVPFYPDRSSVAPWFALAGDGAEYAYVVAPLQPSTWSYNTTAIADYACTVGQIAVWNNDGQFIFFIPAYENNYVDVVAFSN